MKKNKKIKLLKISMTYRDRNFTTTSSNLSITKHITETTQPNIKSAVTE